MNIVAALTKYAATLDAQYAVAAEDRPSDAQIELGRNAAAEALDRAPVLIRLRWDEKRISPKQAAEKLRAGSGGPLDLRSWAHSIKCYQRGESENPKVEALMRSIPNDFSKSDWLAFALAALDQAGVPVSLQDKIEALLPIEDSEEEEAA